MASSLDFGIPAGDESDASSDEWDVGAFPKKSYSFNKNLDDGDVAAEDYISLLKKAIDKEDLNTVEQLLDEGVDVETKLGFDWTPLMYAVSVANYNLAKLLLDRGANANFSKGQRTVLMTSCTSSASEGKSARCVELLLSRNADPNMVDRSQTTCLMLAARGGYSKIINLLVSHSADINTQDKNGYTALSIAVEFGREEAVLKLLQLGADKTIRTTSGESSADLAERLKHTRIARILESSSQLPAAQPFSSLEESVSKFLKTNSECPSSKECATTLDELELLLHGLDLGHLTNIINENDITWSYLLTMDKEDFDKIGITDSRDQQKLMNAVKQDKTDLESVSHLGTSDAAAGVEDLLNFLLTVNQQCWYLTETIQDVANRFPQQTSQLLLSLDPKKEAQIACNQLVLQTNNLYKEVICLRNLLCQTDEAADACPRHQPSSQKRWRSMSSIAVGSLGAAVLVLLCRAAGGHSCMQMFRNVL